MDWIEEKTERLRRYIGNLSLSKSLFCYMLCGIMCALTLWLFTRNLCLSWMNVFLEGRVRQSGGYVREFLLDELLLSDGIPAAWRVTIIIYRYSFPVYLTAASLIVCILFPRKKVDVAGRVIRDAVDAIAAGDFSRKIIYESGDELGAICAGAESLRRMLVEEKNRRWLREENQRQINAAFAHDIRTPLTVIRGYTEFLQRYLPKGRLSEEVVADRLSAMLYQEDRLLQFSETMTRIRQQEEREVALEQVPSGGLSERMTGSARELARQRGLACEVRTGGLSGQLLVDPQIVEESVENLLINAARYAETRIFVEIIREENMLRVFVWDDGPGYSAKALRDGTKAYFSEDKKKGGHFGIGLTISRMLCEKHGGALSLSNSLAGGAIACASFAIGARV